jgi:hypothetical protein
MRGVELRDVETSLVTTSAAYTLTCKLGNTNFGRWTAVVRGAVIFGIEKSVNNELSAMNGAPRSYGVSFNAPYSDIIHTRKDRELDSLTKTAMAVGQLFWLIRKGDLILSDRPRETECTFERHFTENEARRGTVKIYSYEQEDIPERLSTARSG